MDPAEPFFKDFTHFRIAKTSKAWALELELSNAHKSSVPSMPSWHGQTPGRLDKPCGNLCHAGKNRTPEDRCKQKTSSSNI